METARHVGNIDDGHQALIIAYPVEPEALAHIAIQSYTHLSELHWMPNFFALQ